MIYIFPPLLSDSFMLPFSLAFSHDAHVVSSAFFRSRLRNLVLRSEAVTFVFRVLGMRAAEGRASTISSVRIALQLRMRTDLGLFSEPWTIEFHQVVALWCLRCHDNSLRRSSCAAATCRGGCGLPLL